MKKIKLATVFSGIGAVEYAFKRLHIPTEIVFACDNGEREIEYDKEKEFENIKKLHSPIQKKQYVDDLYASKTRKHNFVKDSYLANYKIKNDLYFQDVCLLDGTDFKGEVDLFVGGSPCQSFSRVGYQKGLEDTRGTLFYEFARLINEIQPKVFIYENVKNMINHDKGRTYEIIRKVFDDLGYEITDGILNAKDFGIPQKRNRLFVLGYKKELGIKPILPSCKENAKDLVMQQFLQTHCAYRQLKTDENGELTFGSKVESKVGDRYFLSPAVKKYVLASGTKTWHQKVEIDLPIARTLLKTMGNCHRGGVDNYVTENGKIRMLTEREAHRLMGFDDDYCIKVSVAQAYKQAGNSIVVDVLMEILRTIFKQGALRLED